jgi:DNA-binding MltR family transcriptional regulator
MLAIHSDSRRTYDTELRGNAPLGTLSARIEIAAALGLINDAERHDATVIQKVTQALLWRASSA